MLTSFNTEKTGRSVVFVSIFIIAMFILSNCEEEKAQPREYPRLNTLPVTNITENGATFSADIYSLGTEAITEHGFVWNTGYDPGLNGSNKILLGPAEGPGEFKAEIFTTLSEGKTYNVRGFVKTDEHIVYGKKESFLSLGSGAPQITGFEPEIGEWRDTLKIYGKNFSWVTSSNIVRLNQTQCFPLSSTDTTLIVLINTELTDIKSKISVEIEGNINIYDPKEFTLRIPSFTAIYPVQAKWGDTIAIAGEYLNTDYNWYSVTFSGFPGNIIGHKTDTLLVVVPYELVTVSNDVKIKAYNLILTVPGSLTLIPPYISGISPKEGTWGTVVTIKGRFHPTKTRNTITIGGATQDILSNSRDSIRVRVTIGVSAHDNLVRNIAAPFNVISPDTFRLYAPYIESVSPMAGPSATDVTITGKYLKYYSEYFSQVYFGSEPAWMASVSDKVIKCKVPLGTSNGPIKVTVKTNEQSSVFKDDFIIKNAVISNTYPLTGYYGDEITIEGMNFVFNQFETYVYFRDYNDSYKMESAEIVSLIDNKIVVKVPDGIDSVPKNICVQVGWGVHPSSQQFVLSPPEITSISSSVLTPGQDITISGKNFNPLTSGNQVFWGAYQIPVKSSTTTEIIATVPLYMSRGINKLSVKTAGYKRSYPSLYEVKSKWFGITLPSSFTWRSSTDPGMSGTAFSAGNIGYMMDCLDAQLTSFDPATGEFKDLGKHQQLQYAYGLTGTVNRDTLYIMGGVYGLYRYDKAAGSWIKIGNAPTDLRYGIALSLNGQIYHGLNYSTVPRTLDNKWWAFDAKLKTWVSKNDFPGFSGKFANAYFTLNNKGYVLFGDNVFCEYDPATDTWTQLSSFPGPGTNRARMVSFVIKNKAYVGLGQDYYTSIVNPHDDFWVYDPQTNAWAASTHMPWGARYNSISFVINDKAYIGFGYKSSTPQKDLYEFDPDYPE